MIYLHFGLRQLFIFPILDLATSAAPVVISEHLVPEANSHLVTFADDVALSGIHVEKLVYKGFPFPTDYLNQRLG